MVRDNMKVVLTPVWLSAYKVRQISDDGYTVVGEFTANVLGLSELGNIQKTWPVAQPMFMTNAQQIIDLVTMVGDNLAVYLTSDDPSHRALAQTLARIKGLKRSEE